MASAANNNSGRGRLLHAGFMVPLNELMSENDAFESALGHLKLRSNVYAAVLYYKDASQDTLYSWFEQRKRSSRTGYLRAYYCNGRGDAILEMDVDGKQFYLIASATTAKAPNEMKRDIARGLFGERKPFADRIQVPSFPYKFDANAGFIECEALTDFKKEQAEKREALKVEQEKNNSVVT